MKTIRCDKCGKPIQNGAYREVRSNIVTPVPDDTGVYIADCLYRPVIINDLCGTCSRAFDSAFDDFVFKFMYEGKKTEAATIPQSQGDCNNCKHNGNWAGHEYCLKCHGFDKYERAT